MSVRIRKRAEYRWGNGATLYPEVVALLNGTTSPQTKTRATQGNAGDRSFSIVSIQAELSDWPIQFR